VLNRRSARSAVAQLGDGRILLVTVEGGGSAYSSGMTNYELAVALAQLGAQTAMGLGSGTSAAMAFDGTLLTRPTASEEQPIADALLLSYNGVYAAPPSTTVLSPNGDGADDVQTFAYKLLRSSQVSAAVIGPDRSTRVLAQDAEQPGVHTLTWDGNAAPEGNWRFSISATDDQGHATAAERVFSLNLTLGALQVTLRDNGVAATFALARAAAVTATIERSNGIVVATLLSKKLEPGTQSVSWTGRPGSGYRVRVVATNTIGKATLVAPVTARRS
jgi:flagellar hook assembly protein FlgD